MILPDLETHDPHVPNYYHYPHSSPILTPQKLKVGFSPPFSKTANHSEHKETK